MLTVKTNSGEYSARSEEVVHVWLREKRIAPDDQVYHPDIQAWVPASDILSVRSFLKFRRMIRTPFRAWIWSLLKHPSNGGLWGRLLAFFVVPVALIAVFLGVFLYPPGYYPRIVLAAPGLFVAGLFIVASAPVAFAFTKWLGPVFRFGMPCTGCAQILLVSGRSLGRMQCPDCGAVVW